MAFAPHLIHTTTAPCTMSTWLTASHSMLRTAESTVSPMTSLTNLTGSSTPSQPASQPGGATGEPVMSPGLGLMSKYDQVYLDTLAALTVVDWPTAWRKLRPTLNDAMDWHTASAYEQKVEQIFTLTHTPWHEWLETCQVTGVDAGLPFIELRSITDGMLPDEDVCMALYDCVAAFLGHAIRPINQAVLQTAAQQARDAMLQMARQGARVGAQAQAQAQALAQAQELVQALAQTAPLTSVPPLSVSVSQPLSSEQQASVSLMSAQLAPAVLTPEQFAISHQQTNAHAQPNVQARPKVAVPRPTSVTSMSKSNTTSSRCSGLSVTSAPATSSLSSFFLSKPESLPSTPLDPFPASSLRESSVLDWSFDGNNEEMGELTPEEISKLKKTAAKIAETYEAAETYELAELEHLEEIDNFDYYKHHGSHIFETQATKTDDLAPTRYATIATSGGSTTAGTEWTRAPVGSPNRATKRGAGEICENVEMVEEEEMVEMVRVVEMVQRAEATMGAGTGKVEEVVEERTLGSLEAPTSALQLAGSDLHMHAQHVQHVHVSAQGAGTTAYGLPPPPIPLLPAPPLPMRPRLSLMAPPFQQPPPQQLPPPQQQQQQSPPPQFLSAGMSVGTALPPRVLPARSVPVLDPTCVNPFTVTTHPHAMTMQSSLFPPSPYLPGYAFTLPPGQPQPTLIADLPVRAQIPMQTQPVHPSLYLPASIKPSINAASNPKFATAFAARAPSTLGMVSAPQVSSRPAPPSSANTFSYRPQPLP
mmetsp:Transcript_3781/g.8225  ORF Transcript_3781/g.8225 Transcript_3781/m.8225 type:complete len:761 (-) Transcript_3781:710-2992(-)